jgi:hypothetical protein
MKTSPPASPALISWGLTLLLATTLSAQVPDGPAPAPAAGPAPAAAQPAPAASGGAGAQKGGFLGKDLPTFDPGTEIMTWDGKNWNVNNNRLFQARFEKYLNAPEETTQTDKAYQSIIWAILSDLAPGNATAQNIDAAFKLLTQGSRFEIDAHLCDNVADAVYSAWRAQNAQNRLAAANDALEVESKQQYWNAQHVSAGDNAREADSTQQSGRSTKGGAGGSKMPSQTTAYEDTMRMTEHTKKIAEIEAQIKANSLKRELTSIQSKVEFQALILQFFLQRRFQHVLIATRFYRAVYNDGDTKLNVGKDTKDLFEKSSGMPPTVGTLDSLANEALRDVREGVQAYLFLLQKQELESATKRLAESFTMGEFVPEIRTLPRELKRKALEFSHKSFQLVSAIDVKDYTLAEQLVNDLTKMAKDFDSSKPMAAIETARQISDMHLAKARNASLKGDEVTLQAELTAATELWPRNPALAELSKKIFSLGDVQQKAVIDFDTLYSQKNYRQIYEDSPRYIAAIGFYPEKKAQLQQVLENMKTIEGALLRADEMVRQNNYPGAWESVEKIAQQFPDDTKLSKTRADLTPHAADFVRTLQDAQDMEKRDQVGASLAYYLKARKLYPASDFAGDGITRLVKKIVPES